MEGIYQLKQGSSGLGSEFVCKVSRNKVSFFSNARGISLILNAGLDPQDSSIHFAGYWRASEVPSQGTVFFIIPKNQGSLQLLGKQLANGLTLTGNFNNGQSRYDLILEFNRNFSTFVKVHPFVVFGHHGIQTNANPPFLENSLNAVLHTADYGANGIEVDIRLTKDNVPVLYHDPDLNTRVLQKNGILANLDQVTWKTLFNHVRLRDGQRIPSLAEALDAAIDSTDLQYVWLDIKGNTDVFNYLEPIIRNAISKAQAAGRSIEIITDIPSQDVITEFKKQPSYATLPLMCELSLDQTIGLNCKYWGPRWTQGTLNDDVSRAHGVGMIAYTWTLNSESIIVDFMKNGNFDGLITDYPPYAVYHYYTKE